MLDLKVSHMVLVFIRLYIVQELKGPIRMGLRVYSCKYKVLLALKQWSCIVIHSGLYIGVITWHCLVETKGLVLIFTCDWIIGIQAKTKRCVLYIGPGVFGFIFYSGYYL